MLSGANPGDIIYYRGAQIYGDFENPTVVPGSIGRMVPSTGAASELHGGMNDAFPGGSHALAVAADGDVLFGAWSAGDTPVPGVYRLDTGTGTASLVGLLPVVTLGSSSFHPMPDAIAVAPNGDIIYYVGTYSDIDFSTGEPVVVPASIGRMNPSTGATTPLLAGLTADPSGTPHALAVAADGDVLFGALSAGDTPVPGVYRLDVDTGSSSLVGNIPPTSFVSFDGTPQTASFMPAAIAVAPTGKIIYYQGSFSDIDFAYVPALIGSLDPATGAGSTVLNGVTDEVFGAHPLAVAAGGDVYYGAYSGPFTEEGPTPEPGIYRLDLDTGATSLVGQLPPVDVGGFSFHPMPHAIAVVPVNVGVDADAGGPYELTPGESLTLDASATTYSGTGTLTYSWDIEGVGGSKDAEGSKPTLTWQQLQALGVLPHQTYRVTVTADDGLGQADTDSVNLTVKATGVSLTVAAPGFDNVTDAKVFGTYLPGVNLNVPFRVSATDPEKLIKTVRVLLDGKAVAVTADGPEHWKFTRNVGKLSAGPHTLVVTAYDAKKAQVGGPFSGTIDVSGKPDFELKVAAVGGAATDVEAVRFLAGIDAPVTYTGTLDGVPTFYTVSNPLTFSYQGKIQPVTFTPTGDDSYTFTLTANAKSLPAGTNNATVRVGVKSTVQLGDAQESVLSVAVPGWVKGGTRSFDAAGYHLEGVKLAALSKTFPAATTGLKWLDSKLGKSVVEATPILDIRVPLLLQVGDTNKVTFATSQLQTRAVLFGVYTVWDKTYTAPDLNIGGELNSRTLAAQGLYIRLKQPAGLASQTLLERGVKINLLPSIPPFLAKAQLALALKLVGDLTGNAGVQFSTAGKKVVWDSAGTFIGLTADVTATPSATLNASVLGGFVGEVTGSFALTGVLSLAGEVHFGTGAKSTMKATLSGHYDYTVVGTLLKPIAGGITVLDEHDKDVSLPTVVLFKA